MSNIQPNFWQVPSASTPTAPTSISPRTLSTWIGQGGAAAYSETTFYCGNSRAATEGNSDSVACRVRPMIADTLLAIVNDSALPYETVSDLIRDALLHRVMWLRDNASNPDLRSELDRRLRIIEAEDNAATLERLLEEAEGLTERISDLMTELVAAEAWSTAYRQLLNWREVWGANVEHYGIGRDVVDALELWIDKIKPHYTAAQEAEVRLASVLPIAD